VPVAVSFLLLLYNVLLFTVLSLAFCQPYNSQQDDDDFIKNMFVAVSRLALNTEIRHDATKRKMTMHWCN